MKKIVYLFVITTLVCCTNETETNTNIKSEVTDMVVKEGNATRIADVAENLKNLSDGFMSYPIKFPDKVSMSEYGRDQEAFNSFQTLNNLLRQESLTLDQRVKSYLEENTDKYYYFHLSQWAALVMIDQKLIKQERSERRQEQLAFYTQLLLENEYDHPEVVEKALVALQGYWSNEKINDAANKFLDNAVNSKTARGEGNVLRELAKV